MDLIADTLLFTATLGAAVYCFILSRRLRRFTKLETGMGGAIAALSSQVDDMTRALNQAQAVAVQSEKRLGALSKRGDEVASRLELLVASLHDLPVSSNDQPTGKAPRPTINTPFFKTPMVQPKPAPLHASRAAAHGAKLEGFSAPPRLGEASGPVAAQPPITRRFVRRRFDASLAEIPG